MSPATSARPFIRERASGYFWYGKWSRHGRPVVRAFGRAWVESDGNGGWRRKPGRAPQGVLTEAVAAARMLALMREHDVEQTLLEREAEERRRHGVTFRELAGEYLRWLEDVKGAKPSTLRDHRSLLAEPGQAYRRGSGASRGQIMCALGERPAREVTTREIESCCGRSPRPASHRGPSTRLASSSAQSSTTGRGRAPSPCRRLRRGMPIGAGSPTPPRSRSTRQSRSRRSPQPSRLAHTAMHLDPRSAPARSSRVLVRMPGCRSDPRRRLCRPPTRRAGRPALA
jgi:hypothetical protein